MMKYKPRTEFATAIAQVAIERNIDPSLVIDSIKEAIMAAYRRDCKERNIPVSEEETFIVEINDQTGEARIFKSDGEKKKDEVTPPGFGRIAAQTAKQVILQKIREAEKSSIMDEYSKRLGTLVSGMVLRFEGPNVIVDIGKTESVMTPQEQVRSEGYRVNQRLTFYIDSIQEGLKGKQIIVSRAAKGLVEALFKREVPEVSQGTVEIKEIAREPGVRTKIAVISKQAGVDPVGSCVGQKGVRVQQVIDELLGEKIDVIQWNADPTIFIASALSPANGVKVNINEADKTAVVTVPDDQLSLSIGKEGQNVRLTARLSGYKVDIRGDSEAGSGKLEVGEKKLEVGTEEKEVSKEGKARLAARQVSKVSKATKVSKAKKTKKD